MASTTPKTHETLVAGPSTLRLLAGDLRKLQIPYEIKRIDFINHNTSWKGKHGLGLWILSNDYPKLFNK